jgi:hypothetical protein
MHELETLDTRKVETECTGMVQLATAMIVATDEDAEHASAALKDIKAIQAEIDATFDPVIKAAHAAHKAATSAKKKHCEPLDTAERLIKNKLGTYVLECRRKAEESARVAEEAARREAEQKRQAEAERIAADAATRAATANEEDAILIAAEAAASHYALAAAPLVVLPPPPVAAPVKTAGVSVRTDYDFRIVNAALLPREYLIPDVVTIRQMVKALRGQTAIPGVAVFEVAVTSVRK